MSAMKAEVFGAFGAIDVPEDKADVVGLKTGLTRVEGELALPKWMMGFGLAFLVAITVKLFLP